MPEGYPGLPHLKLPYNGVFENFQRPGTGRSKLPSKVPNRNAHAVQLRNSLNLVLDTARREMAGRTGRVPTNANGYYLTVKGRVNEPLVVEQLESRRAGVELLSVRQADDEEQSLTAYIFVPESAQALLSNKIEQYRTEDSTRGKTPTPRNRNLIDGIQSFSLTFLRELWIDTPSSFPLNRDEALEWEVWLRTGMAETFLAAAQRLEVELGSAPLLFPEDRVFWARCTLSQLEQLNGSTLSIARLGRSKKNSTFPVSGTIQEQTLELEALMAGLTAAADSNVAVCILDTGVGLHHPLIELVVSPGSCFAYRSGWGIFDDHGHGTKMMGLALFGDLHQKSASLSVPYLAESVKIHPPTGQNAHDLLGSITAGAIAIAETASPERERVFCLATSTDEDVFHRGRPTSWSAELDQLASGANFSGAPKRLICVSVGNIRTRVHSTDYGALNDLSEVESPSQSWNALSIGAMTNKVTIASHSHQGWTAMAPSGDLCPTSRTGSWNRSWPIKPDLVLEGGNVAVDPADSFGYGIDELHLATVSNDYPLAAFEPVAETSAATAIATRLAALVMAAYPTLWPETIRGLLVDSAGWTPSMLAGLRADASKNDYRQILRRYGFGVPDESRALQSVKNDLTLIEECDMQPFVKRGSDGPRLNQMKVFDLPWPSVELSALGQKIVRMKVTLSYFIEPNPAEGARNRSGRYASHGFRFAVKLPDETPGEFRRRVNKAAREEDPAESHVSDTFWRLGPTVRDRGSLHSDIWQGPAEDLARRSTIAVFPVGGWWKERPHLLRFNDRARFSLIVRLEAAEQDIDLYTPIAVALSNLVET